MMTLHINIDNEWLVYCPPEWVDRVCDIQMYTQFWTWVVQMSLWRLRSQNSSVHVCMCVHDSICLYFVCRLRALTQRHSSACISHTNNQLAGDLLYERKKVKYAKSRGYNLSVACIFYQVPYCWLFLSYL